MKIISSQITLTELIQMAQQKFGNMVKAVVDIEKGIIAVDAELHADEEALLIAAGSQQQNLWGINIYPELKNEERIEFDSMINLRPAQGNRARNVESAEIREQIIALINKLIVG